MTLRTPALMARAVEALGVARYTCRARMIDATFSIDSTELDPSFLIEELHRRSCHLDRKV